MALIDSRTGNPVDLGLLKDICEGLVFGTSMVCDPKQRRLCEWRIWIGIRKYKQKETISDE